jgi:hypothetical protein
LLRELVEFSFEVFTKSIDQIHQKLEKAKDEKDTNVKRLLADAD